ncbi:MAG: TRAP transporter substrate-binding protein [Desulfobacterales bacterium]|nr:TRAP transporter substrate-binding protein [Desulfobacterales bacterium]
MKKGFVSCLLIGFFFVISVIFSGNALAGTASLDAWKPAFDPSGAKYKSIISCVGHPAIKGVYAGFEFRDLLWERTNGRIYIDFKPLSVLGGEVEVMNQLQMGAIQGMGISSVASTNLGPRFGLVNLPFLINSFEKMEKFVNSGQLFDHYMMAMDHVGITGLDFTGYGNYGWATVSPVKTIEDAKKIRFRIAEASVNQMLYTRWGINPVVMPWPDVPVALKQKVITGLDHTPMVCSISKKFEVAKYYTRVNYAQGLYIWVFNKAWLNSLPEDLRNTFEDVVHEVCANVRKQTEMQENTEIANAKAAGVEFFELSEEDLNELRNKGDMVHEKYAEQINKIHKGDTYKPENFLKEVQDYLGYRQ